MSLTLVLLVAIPLLMAGVGLWIGRRVRATGDFFVAGRSLGPSAHLRDVPRGQHRRRIDRRRRRARLSRRRQRLVVERVGWHRLPRARVLGRPADVARVGRARRPDRRRFPRTPLRRGPAPRGGDPDLDRHALDPRGAAARHVDGVPGRRRRLARSRAALLGAALVSVYFVAGGLLGSAYVNLVQLAVKLAGFAIVTPMALALAGGWDAIAADPSRLDLFAGGSPQSGWRLLFFLGPAFVVSPGLIQKAYGARDERAVTTGIALERRGADCVRGAADAHRHVGARASSGHQQGPRVRDDGERTDAGVWRARAGGRVLGRSQRRRRGALHARDVGLARSVSTVAAGRDRSRLASRGARGRPLPARSSGLGLAMMHRSVIDALDTFYAVMVVTLFVPILGGLYSRGTSRRQRPGLADRCAGAGDRAFHDWRRRIRAR